jgi:hypothetical protein
MEIGMTRQTLIIQTQKGIFLVLYFCILNVRRFMTLPAVYSFVFSFQVIVSKRMVEFFFVKSNHVEFSAVMFAMTGKTIFFCDAGTRMESAILID